MTGVQTCALPISKIFQADILEGQTVPLRQSSIDLIITDLPYGKLTQWQKASNNDQRVQLFLDAVKSYLKPHVIVAIVTNKKEAMHYDGFSKIKSFVVGKRKIYLLSPLP